MNITRSRARKLGTFAIAGIVALQAFNSFTCYDHDLGSFLFVLAFFVAIPLIPAFVALLSRNPLGAVVACGLFGPWLVLAYYTDCVRPYAGGGASMVYVAVFLWGTCSSLVGALLGGFLLRKLGLQVVDDQSGS